MRSSVESLRLESGFVRGLLLCWGAIASAVLASPTQATAKAQVPIAPSLIGREYSEARSVVGDDYPVRFRSGAGDLEVVPVPGMLDVVIWQWPLPGAEIDPRQGLTALCADLVPVPRLLDMHVGAAKQVVRERGLRVASASGKSELSSLEDHKLVIDQLTPPGTLVRTGTAIELVLTNSGRGESTSGFWLLAVGALGVLLGASAALALKR